MLLRLTLFLSFSMLFFSCNQDLYIYANRLRISHKDYTIEGHLVEAKNVKNYHDDVYYYWSDRSKVFKTQGSGSGYLLDGDFVKYFPSGQLFEKGQFDRGKKIGAWTEWNEQGIIIQQSNWKGGLKHGKAFAKNEMTITRTTYKNDLKHGKERIYINDSLLTTNKYRSGRLLKFKMTYEEVDSTSHTNTITKNSMYNAGEDSTVTQKPVFQRIFKRKSDEDK